MKALTSEEAEKLIEEAFGKEFRNNYLGRLWNMINDGTADAKFQLPNCKQLVKLDDNKYIIETKN